MGVKKSRPPNTSTDVCGCALSVMLLTLAVVLSTPHDYSGTFQGGYSARFTASRRALKGARRALYPLKQLKESAYTHNLLYHTQHCHCDVESE